ncbi:MAG: monovalent cation/H+ antiporter complex subunit F [Planctomycetota bacterium]
MYGVSALFLLVGMGLTLLRALKGPTVFDRILAVNVFGTATVLLVSVMGFMGQRADLVDIALIYALISFTGTIAVLRFVEYGRANETYDFDEVDA